MSSAPEPRSALARSLDHLERRSLPYFNQLVVWLLLASSFLLACVPFSVTLGLRVSPTTILSWLPAAVLGNALVFFLFRALLIAGATLWMLGRGLPWSCWLTVLGFTGLWSMHVENTTNTSHIFHMTNMLLVIQAIWHTADAAAIKEAARQNRFWATPLVPRWVTLASIAYIGIFHTAAGLSKLAFSGPEWASGTSLQLWTYLWGYSWSPTTQAIVNSRSLTRVLQVGTLVIETAGIFALVPSLRPWIGLALLGFYGGVIATFDYGFELNALFTALYLLPCERWINGRYTAARPQTDHWDR